MASFRYRALTGSGAVVAGVLEAPSREAAVAQLRSLGQFPISASDADASGWRRHLARPAAAVMRLDACPRPRQS